MISADSLNTYYDTGLFAWDSGLIGFFVLVGSVLLFGGFIILVIAAVSLWEKWKAGSEIHDRGADVDE